MSKQDRILRWARLYAPTENKENMIALIESGGRILSVGRNNMTKTHPHTFNGKYTKGLHAEQDCIKRADTDLSGADLYVFYIKKSGDFGNSRPCDMCLGDIRGAGIRRVFFMEDGDWVSERI